MTSSTLATVIVAAADQAAAQTDFPGYFFTGLSADGAAPATRFVTNGYFGDDELTKITNDVTWPRKVYFGEFQAALSEAGLVLVAELQGITS